MEGLVKKSADISLKVQIVAGILTFLGSNVKVSEEHQVLSLKSLLYISLEVCDVSCE